MLIERQSNDDKNKDSDGSTFHVREGSKRIKGIILALPGPASPLRGILLATSNLLCHLSLLLDATLGLVIAHADSALCHCLNILLASQHLEWRNDVALGPVLVHGISAIRQRLNNFFI